MEKLLSLLSFLKVNLGTVRRQRIQNQKLLLKIRKLIHEFPMGITLYEGNDGQP